MSTDTVKVGVESQATLRFHPGRAINVT